MLSWHLIVWPMETNLQNIIYLLNEYLYSACTMCSLGFSDYTIDADSKFTIGWYYLMLLGAIILPSFVLILYDIIKGTWSFFKKRREAHKINATKKKNAEQELVD